MRTILPKRVHTGPYLLAISCEAVKLLVQALALYLVVNQYLESGSLFHVATVLHGEEHTQGATTQDKSEGRHSTRSWDKRDLGVHLRGFPILSELSACGGPVCAT